MILFSETNVLTLSGLVRSDTTFIITAGPMARTKSTTSLDNFFQGIANKTFYTVGTVICCDDELFRYVLEFFFEEHQILAAGTQYDGNVIAAGMQVFSQRDCSGSTYAACYENNISELLTGKA